jgi:triacylglycerol lipase
VRTLNLSFLACCAVFGCSNSSAGEDLPADAADTTDEGPTLDAPPQTRQLPILFVHGINGEAANFDALKQRLAADGWPANLLYAYTFENAGQTGCNVDHAEDIEGWVNDIMTTHGVDKVNVIAHSMGTLSSRYFLKMMGGMDKVERFITLGGMHHGLTSACAGTSLPFAPCTWAELCETGAFIANLNAAPATPGELYWVSIAGTSDTTVPNASSHLDGAENITIPSVTHGGLLDDAPTYTEIERVLAYPDH